MRKKKFGKKVLAVVLATSMVAGYFPTLKESVLAAGSESITFDEEHVVLKMGVMSDIHLSYVYHSAEHIKANVENYAKAVGTLNAMSGNDLDVLMLAGDYTSYGCYEQGKTFASASQAIMDEINKDKADDDKTQFFFTYGNHDTEWTGQMSYANWEKLLGEEYHLLDGVTKGPENTGCYKYTKTVEGKTYYFFSVETERYNAPSNMFCNEVLEWLDEELSKTPTDAYVYVVSHGPIKETGVYGADIEYEKNADWGTAEDGYTQDNFQRNTDGDTSTWNLSSDINSVLEKYPQVVYFSGHTHMTNELESTIMSDAYTAITVAQYYSADLYSSLSKYLDAGQNMTRPGYSLYVEVDKNGNQRITRVNTKDSTLVDSVTVEGTESSVTNPSAADAATYPNINAYYTTKVSMTTTSSGSAKTLKTWTMKAPTADKSHLTTYSAATRQENPVFNNGALTIDKMLNNSGESMTFTYTFPTAHCTDGHVIRYNLTLYTSDGNALDTQWILGDWTDNTDGVTESGKTHFDATKLTYSVTYDGAKFVGVTDVYAKVTAVNEFGGKTTLTSENEDVSEAVGIMKPTAVNANKNLFDGLSGEDVICNVANAVSSTFDHKGRATTVINTTTNAEVIYDLSDASLIGTTWGRVTRYGRSSTDLDVEDTFVYQTEFSIQKHDGLYFTFRAVESADNHWKADYSGVYMDHNGVTLKLNQENVAFNNGFKLTDTETHKLLIVSAPTTVSVWVDDCMIFSNQPYDVTQATSFSGEGTSENPYKHNGITLQNTDMVPVIGFYLNGSGAEFTVSNQYLYVYDQQAQVRDDWKATERNYFEAGQATAGGNVTITEKTATGLTFDATATSNSLYDNYVELELSDELQVTDTVITEFDYTPSSMADSDTNSWNNIVGVTIQFRSYGTESNETAKLLLRKNGPQNIFHFEDGSDMKWMTYQGNAVVEGKTVHVKIVHNNTSAVVYMDGNRVAEYNYTDVKSSVNTDNMKPIFRIGATHANYKIENISIRKAYGSGTLDEVTPVTKSNNLLNGDYGQITSSFKGSSWEGKSNSVVSGNNFYTDLTWQNLEANGETSFYMGENFYPFGSKNENSPLKGTESVVTSTLVRVANAENGKYNHRFGMTVADYNGTTLWYFVTQTTLHVLTTDADVTKFIASIDLKKEIAYQVGDYVRMTTVVNPYGFDIYMNGVRIYRYADSDGQNVSYAELKWMASGTSVRFLDASVSYNYDDITAYKTGLQAEIDSYENLQGVYFEKTDSITAQINKVKQACLEATKSSDLWSYAGTVLKAVQTAGKVVNHFVFDGTTAVGLKKSVDLDGTKNTSWSTISIPLFNEKSCAFTEKDTWVVEADVTVVKAWMNPRVGFSLRNDANPDVMIQHAAAFYYESSSNNWKELTDTQATERIQTGSAWHVKYVVKPNDSIQTIVTSMSDGTKIASYSVAWNQLRTISEAEYAPALYFACADVEVSNIYVGYDLSDDVAALKQAVTAAEQKDLSAYTWESAQTYKVALDSTKEMNVEVQGYLDGASENVYTTPYSKKEMCDKVAELATAEENLVTATATIGTTGVGSGTLSVGVANGAKLPTKEYVDGKYYVIGWTYNGVAVTTVNDVSCIAEYVPEYIDLDMLQVKKQAKANKDDASDIDIRFISSVNSLDYEKAGLVFSVYNENPTVGSSRCFNKEISKVYNSLYADGDKQTADNIYGNKYSKYLFAYEYLGFSEGEKVYVRAYVKLNDGTIVYGDARTVTATLSQEK